VILDLYFEEGIVGLCKTLALSLVACCKFVLVLLHVMKYVKFNKGLNVCHNDECSV
jgi:hypothetical protein